MGASSIIFLVLLVLIVAFLPIWKYSRAWGGGYRMSVIVGMMLAAHVYTVTFVNN